MDKKPAIICPITVANAAPATPISGSPNRPKIKIGSRIILIMAPSPCVNIVITVLPVACSIRSNIS